MLFKSLMVLGAIRSVGGNLLYLRADGDPYQSSPEVLPSRKCCCVHSFKKDGL